MLHLRKEAPVSELVPGTALVENRAHDQRWTVRRLLFLFPFVLKPPGLRRSHRQGLSLLGLD